MQNPFLNSSRIRAALRSLELRPTRGMGQNFLIDSAALTQIVSAADLHDDDVVLEIGPGLGVLTWELLQRVGRVIAIELDKRLAARLREEFGTNSRLTIIQADILKVEPATVLRSEHELPERSYKVVANLPYAITSPVLRHLLEASLKPSLIVVLVQWEVAQRIAAQPGDLSVLAHSVQIYAEPEIIARVKSDSFIPAPTVDSAVLRLRVRPHPTINADDIDPLLRVIKAGFLQARKKLSNALPGGLAAMGIPIEKAQAVGALQNAGVDPERRAETVTLEEWARVYQSLPKQKPGMTDDEQ